MLIEERKLLCENQSNKEQRMSKKRMGNGGTNLPWQFH
jgi:hypothetical protein